MLLLFVTILLSTDTTQPTTKTYYVSLAITNKSPIDVTIAYYENGVLKEENLTKGGIDSILLTMTSDKQPAPVTFEAFEAGTANVIKMNGEISVKVTPTLELTAVPVVIGEGELTFFKAILPQKLESLKSIIESSNASNSSYGLLMSFQMLARKV